MGENSTYTGSTTFKLTNLNTSCTGGTISDISKATEDGANNPESYILTVKELRSCKGFEKISYQEAQLIIQSLSQLSSLCYQIFINDRPSKI